MSQPLHVACNAHTHTHREKLSLTHTHTHSLTHSLTHIYTHTPTLSLSRTLARAHTHSAHVGSADGFARLLLECASERARDEESGKVGAGERRELGGGCHAALHRRPHPVCWFVACEEIGSVGQEGGRDAVWRGGQSAEMEGERKGGRRGEAGTGYWGVFSE